MLRRRTSGGKKRPGPKSKKKASAVARTRSRVSDDARVTRHAVVDEDRLDVEAARKALAEPERIPYEQVRRDLGLWVAVYRIVTTRAAQQDLAALPKQMLTRADARILTLADAPRPPGVTLLHGSERLLRIRVGDYRILYQVDDTSRTVTVARVRHRRDVYRRL
jgi:mRNA interferase RelE/StbE